jgi:hypothetical protein
VGAVLRPPLWRDPRGAVRAVFSWSYRYLRPDVARAFRRTAVETAPPQNTVDVPPGRGGSAGFADPAGDAPNAAIWPSWTTGAAVPVGVSRR